MKYFTKITGWGEDALGFLEEEDMNFLVIFNNTAPDELAEISLLHEPAELKADPAPGDTLMIGGKAFDVTAVGTEAIHTLRTLGHCTLSFQGGTEPERPGCIMLEGEESLRKEDITVGSSIELY